MAQSKKEILELFTEMYQEATDEPQEDVFLLTEKDEVRIIFYGHYPEYSDDFDLIQKKLKTFFDFSDEELLDID